MVISRTEQLTLLKIETFEATRQSNRQNMRRAMKLRLPIFGQTVETYISPAKGEPRIVIKALFPLKCYTVFLGQDTNDPKHFSGFLPDYFGNGFTRFDVWDKGKKAEVQVWLKELENQQRPVA